jgi:hypothetical protein
MRAGSMLRAIANCRAEAPTVTGSLLAIADATATQARRAGAAASRQLSGRSGQSIQQPRCGSNSPGMRKPAAEGQDFSVFGIAFPSASEPDEHNAKSRGAAVPRTT